MAAKSDDGEVCLEIIKNKQGQDHEMVNLEMEASGDESRRPSGSAQANLATLGRMSRTSLRPNRTKLTRVS